MKIGWKKLGAGEIGPGIKPKKKGKLFPGLLLVSPGLLASIAALAPAGSYIN